MNNVSVTNINLVERTDFMFMCALMKLIGAANSVNASHSDEWGEIIVKQLCQLITTDGKKQL